MSRIKSFLTVTAGAAAGLFLSALAAAGSAHADTAPIAPGLPGVFEQVVASSAMIPQQLLQSTSSALTGSQLAPAMPAQGPLATVTLNTPQAPGTLGSTASPAGLPGLGNLGSMLPFPMPNFGGSTPVTAAAPTMMSPAAAIPSALLSPAAMAPVAMTPVDPVAVALIPGLP